MKIEIKLIKSKIEKPDGFPLVIDISHKGTRRQKILCYSKIEHFNEDAKMISSKHPDYDIMAPIIMDLKIKSRKIMLNKVSSIEKAYEELFKVDFSGMSFSDWAVDLISDMNHMADRYDKIGDVSSRNKIKGNIRVYENVMSQFNSIVPAVLLMDLDYDNLMRFKNYQLGIGNKKNTVHLYLRTLRTIYNKGVLKNRLPDSKPFKGIFDGLKTKSYDNKKKNITKESLRKLEKFDFGNEKQKYVDLFLLQFYLGGADLIDIYYLKKINYRKKRMYFERGKVNTGLMLDLAVHPKAVALIEKYPSGDEWLFPWRKDKLGYEGFRRRYLRALDLAVDLINKSELIKKEQDSSYEPDIIEVLPMGGKLGVKVTRHTFATIAKNLLIEPDLIRELMGHERDDVDNYYKDRFPVEMRDEALFMIID